MRAILIATGHYHELSPIVHHRPTPLVGVGNKPILFHIIEQLASHGVTCVEIVLHHLPEQIESRVLTGERWGVEVTYHLVKDERYPFSSVRVAAENWGDDDLDLIVGSGDFLPYDVLDQLFVGGGERFVFTEEGEEGEEREEAWTGWGRVSRDRVVALPRYAPLSSLLDATSKKIKIVSSAAIGSQNFAQLLGSNKRCVERKTPCLFPPSAREQSPGVWVSKDTEVHATAELIPPVLIGESCRIKAQASVGPNVIIEDHCIVDTESRLEDAVVCQYSYVGEGLDIKDSVVDRNVLVNVAHDTQLTIQDDFILCSLETSSVSKSFFHLFERIFAGGALLLLSPLFLACLLRYSICSEEAVCLPTSSSSDEWKVFRWIDWDWEECPLGFCRYFPGLLHVLRGEAHLLGVPHRSKREIQQLPVEWQHIYLNAKVGVVSLAALEGRDESDRDALYSAEAYYTANMGARFDLQMLLRRGKKLSAERMDLSRPF